MTSWKTIRSLISHLPLSFQDVFFPFKEYGPHTTNFLFFLFLPWPLLLKHHYPLKASATSWNPAEDLNQPHTLFSGQTHQNPNWHAVNVFSFVTTKHSDQPHIPAGIWGWGGYAWTGMMRCGVSVILSASDFRQHRLFSSCHQ